MEHQIEWLEPFVEKEINDISEMCEDKTSNYYNQINLLLNDLHNGKGEPSQIISSIENAVLMKTREAAEISFKYAFYKGIDIGKCLK